MKKKEIKLGQDKMKNMSNAELWGIKHGETLKERHELKIR